MKQRARGGDHATIIQAGRDAVLTIPKCPPQIKLVRIEIKEDEEFCTMRQKINIILKNNGDIAAFLLKGNLINEGSETICLCNEIGMQYHLSQADWTYDVDISEPNPCFTGQHSIAPNEVVNFNIMVGRKEGGHEPTVYRTVLQFDFDEGERLVTEPFFLMISGPCVFHGGSRATGPTSEEWAKCQVDNIRRLDAIGFNFREYIDESSKQFIEAVEPGIFDEI